ncbi:MAG: lipoprotein signal peptidase [Gammaproteobacteria bacterium]|nr:lipoprotein signal peptidase [Gammaproteobacteria bacterium]
MTDPLRSGWRWLPLSVVLIVADQWTKGLIEARFALGESSSVWFWFDLTRLHNAGAAFSFLAGQDGWQIGFLSVLAVVVSVALVIWLRSLDARRDVVLCVALALVLAGAIGNVIDRIEHGYVVDFIHVHWQGAYFPAFNVADSAITVGAVLLLLDALRDWRASRGGA